MRTQVDDAEQDFLARQQLKDGRVKVRLRRLNRDCFGNALIELRQKGIASIVEEIADHIDPELAQHLVTFKEAV